MQKKTNQRIGWKNLLTTVLLLAFGAVLIGVFYVPQKMEEYECKKFAEPLFNHLLPENSYSVQSSSVRDENGGTTAAAIVGTHLTQEELLAFYSDTEYPPAREGETVELAVKQLDEESIKVLKEAGLYREEETFYFVYIYSSKAE